MKLRIVLMAVAGWLVCLSGVSVAWAQSTAAPNGSAQARSVLNLNTATPAQLEELPGVGPQMASRIKEYREKNGGFKKVEDLMKIKGLGEKAFLRLRPLVSVTPPNSPETGATGRQ